jgi:hypothetical protein
MQNKTNWQIMKESADKDELKELKQIERDYKKDIADRKRPTPKQQIANYFGIVPNRKYQKDE